MRYIPRSRRSVWAGPLIGALLILTSCGDDATAVHFGPGPDVPEQDPLDPTDPDATDPALTDSAPTGVDRSDELIGRFDIVNYALADGGGLTNIVGSIVPYLEFNPDGTLEFQTGCNGGTAAWQASGTYYESDAGFLDDTPEGQPIAITDVSKEEAACDGFLGEQDVDLVDNALATERFQVTDDGGVNLLDDFLVIASEPAS